MIMIMKTKNILFVIVLFFFFLLNIVSAPFLTAQSLKNNFDQNEKKDIFQRVETAISPNELQVNFYPIADGDFWEYITVDTTTLLGQFYSGLNFSITKEIVDDTLMTNGITYKKLKWENIANSVNYPEWYDYHRIDTTGNVHLFYEGSDYLLFDFSLGIGQSYPSHLSNHTWKITDRYEVIGFGDTLQAIDFELLEQGTISKEKYSFVENFGIIYYQQNITDYAMPQGNFWGAVIDGEEYGTMIATKQTVDWSEFYPLHIGDYWVYEGQSGSIPFTRTKRIIDYIMMPDNNFYFLTEDSLLERIDSSGSIFNWNILAQKGLKIRAMSSIIGDTIKTDDFGEGARLRVNYKYPAEIFLFLYPDLIYFGEYYTSGLGLTYWTIEGGWGYLRGSYINGVLYGDTTITQVDENHSQVPNAIVLYQNYPNPFNPSTTINYTLKEDGFVSLKVYDLLGSEVDDLVNEKQTAGAHVVTFNSDDLNSGVYFYRLVVNDFTQAKKMILVK